MKRIVLALLVFYVAGTAIGNAQNQPPAVYSKDEIDAKIKAGIDARINDLRSFYSDQFVSKTEFDAIKTLQLDIKQLIDGNQKLGEQIEHSIGQALDGFHSDMNKVVDIERAGQQANAAITQDLKEIEGSLSNPPAPSFLTIPPIGIFLAAIIGALTGSGLTSYILVHIAKSYTGRLKMIESTFEFSKRFGELLHQQSELNNAYLEDRMTDATKNNSPTPLETNAARIWWWRFFDLMVYEYDFFKNGLLWNERYIEWMKWRWHDFNDKEADVFATCGINYAAGWKMWKERRPNEKNRIIGFFDDIHKQKNTDEVEKYVKSKSPPKPYKYHLVDGS